MTKQYLTYALSSAVITMAWLACTPSRDLDATAAGNAHAGAGGVTASSTSATSAGATPTGGSAYALSSEVGGRATGGMGDLTAGGATAAGGTWVTGGATSSPLGGAGFGGTSEAPVGGTLSGTGSSVIGTSTGALHASGGTPNTVVQTGGMAPTSGGMGSSGGASVATGGKAPTSGGVTSSGGTSAETGGVKPTGGTRSTTAIAADLGDLLNAPVEGYIAYSTTANWDVEGVKMEAFRIETPTATYFVAKSVAAITSLVDAGNTPWVIYSSGYRTHRGVPNLGGCCQPNPPTAQPTMTTVLDTASVTSTHLRLISKPTDGDYFWLVWDFYVTHVTVTVNRSKGAFGFTYDGVPGNSLDSNDKLVLSTGDVKGPTSYYTGDLPGPAEWAYIANGEGAKSGSLFLIQHTDDSVAESYSVPDGDGSRFTFGSGQLTSTPIRFSLGLIGSTDHATVSARVKYVIDNIPP